MSLPILIVAAGEARTRIESAVVRAGCTPRAVAPDEVEGMVADADRRPALLVVQMEGVDAAGLLAALRRSPSGAALPVVLVGSMGRDVRDLADVLEIGADHFVEQESLDRDLPGAVTEILGLAPVPPEGPGAAVGAEAVEDLERTVVLDDAEGTAGRGDGALRRVRRALEKVERARGDGDAADAAVDLAFLDQGFDGGPEAPGESGVRSLDPGLSIELSTTGAAFKPPAKAPRRVDPAEATSPGLDAGTAVSGRTPGDDLRPVPMPFVPVRRAIGRLPVDLEGHLADAEPARVLYELSEVRFSGAVRFELPGATKVVHLREGVVVHARGTAERDLLVTGLWLRGRLTRSQYEAARRLVAKDPRRAGTLLVEAGFLKASELPDVLRQHVRDVAAEVLACLEGTYRIDPMEGAEPPVRLDEPMVRFLLEGVDRFVPAPALRRGLGEQAFPVLRGPLGAPQGPVRDLSETALVRLAGLSEDEGRFLRSLDGRTRICDLELAWAGREVRVLPLLYVLHVAGRLDLREDAMPREGRAAAAVDEERILDRWKVVREGDYFQVLGVERPASAEEVRRAAADLRQVFDPSHIDPEVAQRYSDALEEIRTAVGQAERVLLDETLRETYLAHLEDT